MSIEELKRENEILKDALCMEQDRLSHARHHIQNAQDRIKRLEEAGDLLTRMVCRQDGYGMYPDEEDAVNSWCEAKEAKP